MSDTAWMENMQELAERVRMIFSPYACFPQVPSIAAVRIALATSTGKPWYAEQWRPESGCTAPTGVMPEDLRSYEFCEANCETFVENAQRCIDSLRAVYWVTGGEKGQLPPWVAREDDQRRLDREIASALELMCVYAVPEAQRDAVYQAELVRPEATPAWERERAETLLRQLCSD